MSDNKRRQFLKNSSLAALSLLIIPKLSKAAAPAPVPPAACDPTTLDYYGEGPFYTANPPTISNAQLADQNEAGTRLVITGRVRNLDCNEFLPNCVVDVWHANDAGEYDNTGYNLRGQTVSNAQGFYTFETIYPGKYLNGNVFRPAHIHFKITPEGFPTMTTQLYFEGDPDNDTDPASSITSGTYDATERIIPLTTDANGVRNGTWDIVIDGDGVSTSVPDLHIESGMIYSAGPNPFSDRVEIKYGVFRNARVSLLVFDMMGRQVAVLEERHLSAEKYTAVWQPDAGLPNGHYFIALKVNDLQVHYLKVVRSR